MMIPAPVSDSPVLLDERIVCSITAATRFDVPAPILLAIAEKEGGKPGMWVKNKNGTFDVGVMQFNTRYLKDLEVYGITPDDVAKKGCFSYDLAALRIRGHLLEGSGDIYTRAARYHSRTPPHNAVYRKDLIGKVQKWNGWLETHFISQKKPSIIHSKTLHIDHLKISTQPAAKDVMDAFYGQNRFEFYGKTS